MVCVHIFMRTSSSATQYFGEYYGVLAPELVRFAKFDEVLVEGQNTYINEIYGVDVAKLIDLTH